MALSVFQPSPWILAAAVVLDLLIGDPVYPAHPIRLLGKSLAWLESVLRKLGTDGYAGGICLFLLLSLIWVGGSIALLLGLQRRNSLAVALVQIFIVYSCLALHDLLRHAWAVEAAAKRGDLTGARSAISMLVGRDTGRMDIAACRRASIESLSENLADGFVSPLFWYVLLGVPGIVLFKVVSTMDSMVGYKTPQYLQFGWCGARLDDVMNYVPARLTWLLLSALCVAIPGCSGAKALAVGWHQHATLPGPNSGWSEAAIAGGLRRRLLGPIWKSGVLVTEVWLGDPDDPPAGDDSDVLRASTITAATGLFAASLAAVVSALRV